MGESKGCGDGKLLPTLSVESDCPFFELILGHSVFAYALTEGLCVKRRSVWMGARYTFKDFQRTSGNFAVQIFPDPCICIFLLHLILSFSSGSGAS